MTTDLGFIQNLFPQSIYMGLVRTYIFDTQISLSLDQIHPVGNSWCWGEDSVSDGPTDLGSASGHRGDGVQAF